MADFITESSAPVPSATRGVGRLGGWDAACIGATIVLMAVFSYLRSRDRMFWSDELMGWLVIREKTIGSMIHSWQGGLDSGSLLYLFGGRWWMDVFGPSEVSLRLFSAAGVAASFVVLWVCARRYFPVLVVAICLPLTYFASKAVAWQFYNGRMYGGFLLATALVAYAFLEADPRRALTSRLLVLTFLAHLCLMGSHILGPLYSGVFIAGLVAQDLWARQFRLKLYLSAMASWIVLLVSIKNTQSTMALGKPVYFTVRPTLTNLTLGMFVYGRQLREIALLLLLAAVIMTLVFRRRPSQTIAATPPRTPLYFLLGSFAAIAVVMFAISRVTTSIFLDRYLLPLILGDGLLLCELVQRVLQPVERFRAVRYAAIACGLGIFALAYRNQYRFPFGLPVRDYTAGMLASLPAGYPIVIANTGVFSEMSFYQSQHVLMVYPVDWSVNLDPDAGLMAQIGAHEMDNWKLAGYYADRILPTQEILGRFPDFVLIQDPGHTLWFRRYLKNNPKYQVTFKGISQDCEVWLVQTRR